jgi:hypothetical protein
MAMRRLVHPLLCLLLPVLAYAQDSGNAQVQPSLPVQPGSANLLPQSGSVLPPQTPKESGLGWNGLTLAIGLGYGIPFGGPIYSQWGTAGVGDEVSGQLPLSLSFGYRPIPLLSFGVALDYAPLFVKNCDTSCSGRDTHLGGELRLHISPWRPFYPWASAGFGYEWFGILKNPGSPNPTEERATGFDFDLRVGSDVSITDLLAIGPYVELRVGTFRHFYGKCGDRGCAVLDIDIPDADRTMHEWLVFGLRGVLSNFRNPVRAGIP